MDLSQELYGIVGEYFLGKSTWQAGGISQDIRVPISKNGLTSKFQGKYVHVLIPFTGSVSLGPASVDVPSAWSTQEFVLDFNLKIGS
ncbi:hypothetical protein [Bacillus testis]|uniref:hypothetical protein n=1 Tax=Bacillus testis TaxID=1622072 RepID=UPI0011C8063B|nr:hypothetical protein [Bacillus testis]